MDGGRQQDFGPPAGLFYIPMKRHPADFARIRRPLILAALFVSAFLVPPAVAGDQASVAYEKDILPFLSRHCVACHRGEKPKADLNLARFQDEAAVLADRKTWDGVLHMRDRKSTRLNSSH